MVNSHLAPKLAPGCVPGGRRRYRTSPHNVDTKSESFWCGTAPAGDGGFHVRLSRRRGVSPQVSSRWRLLPTELNRDDLEVVDPVEGVDVDGVER
jgi:hypothetical protein